MNDSTVKALRKLKDGNGKHFLRPSVPVGVPDMILNRPYHTSSYIPDLTAGNKVMAFLVILATTGLLIDKIVLSKY